MIYVREINNVFIIVGKVLFVCIRLNNCRNFVFTRAMLRLFAVVKFCIAEIKKHEFCFVTHFFVIYTPYQVSIRMDNIICFIIRNRNVSENYIKIQESFELRSDNSSIIMNLSEPIITTSIN